jgi:hypothetical protein
VERDHGPVAAGNHRLRSDRSMTGLSREPGSGTSHFGKGSHNSCRGFT